MLLVRLAFVCAVVFYSMSARADIKAENFLLKTTADLIALCSADGKGKDDVAAIHFCHGYLVGLTQFHAVVNKIFEGKIYCVNDENRPSRNDAIAMFLKWGKSNTQFHNELPLNGLLKWAAEAYPCS